MVYLLASSPKSFNALVTALEANAEVPRMEIVTERLLNKERKQRDHETSVRPLEVVHSDVCGKLKNKSLSGAEYFLTFIDDKTHFTWVYTLKKKDEVFQKFTEWNVMVERESRHRLKLYAQIMEASTLQLSSRSIWRRKELDMN